MKKQKVFALALAGVTTLGALAAGTPVMAEEGHSGNTTVNLNVEAVQGKFLLTVPANVILNSAGEAFDFADDASNGIKVSGSNMTSSVVVSATSQNGWTLKAEGIDDYFNYHLYMDKNGGEGFEKMEFTADEVNTGDGAGTTKMVYAKAEANDNAKAGTYSDVITFTAEATGTSGGETPSEDEEKYEYVKVTEENLEALLGNVALGNETVEFDSADEALKQAKSIRDEKGLEYAGVIYRFEDGVFWCADSEEFNDQQISYKDLKDVVSPDSGEVLNLHIKVKR